MQRKYNKKKTPNLKIIKIVYFCPKKYCITAIKIWEYNHLYYLKI